jgi:hypothetical protein
VFLQYFFYPKRRIPALRWFSGYAVDDGDLRLLNVGDRSAQDTAALEQEARDILQSLDTLLSHYSGRPLVVFFDQLENMRTEELIQKFCQLVYFLSDQCRSMLPVAFFRQTLWDNEFKPKIDSACSERLEANKMLITGANREQAVALVKSRLKHVLGRTKRPDELYPFYPHYREAFDAMFSYGETFPRQVLIGSNRLLRDIIEGKTPAPRPENGGDPLDILASEFESRHQEILAEFNEFSPDEGRLTLALEQYLINRPQDGPYRFDDLEWSPNRIRYIDLRGDLIKNGQTTGEAVFMVDVELHHRSVGASLDRGLNHLRDHGQNGRALYVRDKRCKFPETWRRNNQRLEELRELGGGAVFLDDKQAARWYALARLKQDVVSGDVTDHSGRMIGEDQYRRFVRERVDGEKYPGFKPIDDYFLGIVNGPNGNGNGRNYAEISQTAMDVLFKSPAKMMKGDFLAVEVTRRLKLEEALDAEALLSAFNQADKSDVFSVFGSPPGVIVQLRVRKYHAQG